jgi:hypothetical protein
LIRLGIHVEHEQDPPARIAAETGNAAFIQCSWITACGSDVSTSRPGICMRVSVLIDEKYGEDPNRG